MITCAYFSPQLTEILQESARISRPSRSLTSAFEPYMTIFIEAQDKYVLELLCIWNITF